MASFINKTLPILLGILISGLCWFFSCDLSGNFWYLLWIAPIPILHLSFKSGWKISFFTAFLAYLIGRLSWAHYLFSVIPFVPAVLITLFIPLIFAIIIVGNRRIVLNHSKWWIVFAFPVFWTTFEYLLISLSPDGTAGSIAYSQMNFRQIIQISSLTGIAGITFILTLFPSALALVLHFGVKHFVSRSIIIICSPILVISLLFGFFRLQRPLTGLPLQVGLACIDESKHEETNHPNAINEIQAANLYAESISALSKKGATIVLLPEKILAATPAIDSVVIKILKESAVQNQVDVIASYTQIKENSKKNAGLVITSEGELLTSYLKVNLFEGEKYNGFINGYNIGLFTLNNFPAGIAICKDLDYDAFIRKYGRANIRILFVPAWDFVQDGWLHSRMAIMRGIENGFSIVRTAREGRLTISDPYGRVLAESSSEDEKNHILSDNVSLQKIPTLYNSIGNSFGMINLIAALIFMFLIRKNQV
jgi:apolipoprotein N-acyltransferase